jgi:hypothetical protein
MHAICEKDELLRAAVNPIEYYDDEELDAYKGIPSDAYNEEQEAEFRYVFETMWSSDVAGWVHSLQLRGIELPDGLKDEVLMMMEENS